MSRADTALPIEMPIMNSAVISPTCRKIEPKAVWYKYISRMLLPMPTAPVVNTSA